MKHYVKQHFHTQTVKVDLVGCGGTGSLVLAGLVRLHLAMKSLGHPRGLHVTAWDPDRVSQANIGRQLFTESEVGLFKSDCLINRYNMHFGLEWDSVTERYTGRQRHMPNVIISCVDTAKSRAEINSLLPYMFSPYVIDGGNSDSSCQVVIGNGSQELPYPYQVLPELIETKSDEPNRPSCSLAEAIEHQGLFLNQWVATAILELFWQLFRKGGLEYAGFFINLESGRMNPAPIKGGL